MKGTFIKILKVLFILSAVVLTVLLTFGGVLLLDWPWWVGFFILLGLIGLWIAILFFRKLWLKRREQQFVNQIIEHDESQLNQLAERDRVDAKEMQERWREAIDALKRSHLRKRGNPLYVLPWYLIIGESGSGKTTAIQSARLSSSFSEVTRISGISGTRNCDWWFFEQAILIDTAGRYTIRIDEERDKEEWQKFLTLLARYRQKEPINGLIVSVAADKLLQGTPEALGEDGRNVRRRIDELMRVLGAKFPVYVLVTKGDLVQGMTQFSNQLPEKSLDQAMGFVNQDLSTDVNSFLDRVFDKTGERLRDLRLLILHQTESRKVDPPLLLFPEEFEKVKPGLESFMKIAFQQNPYQETPIFRGLFFSSGRQEGTPYSHFLKTLGLIEEKDVLPGTNKGIFLHDLFSKILPKDRALFAPTRRSLEWSRITRNLGLTAWIALGLAICGLLSFSFVKNLRALRLVTHEFTERAEFRGEIQGDMATLDRFRQAILKVEEANRGWWIPRFELNQSKQVEILLKDYYCKTFQKSFLAAFDEQMFARMAGFSIATPDVVIGNHVSHLVRRINLLKARLGGQGLEGLQAKPQPSYDPSLSISERATIAQKKDLFGYLYLYYLIWRLDTSQLNVETSVLQKWLDQVLAVKRDLHWLVGWANAQPSLSPVTLEPFWAGSLPMKEEVKVPPAYTRKGKQEIDSFIAEIDQALVSPQILARPKAEFAEWYRREYLGSWNIFLTLFPKGVERLKGREEWQQTASRMAGSEGPYFAVLNRSAAELEPLAFEKDMPGWLKLIFQFQIVKSQVATEELSQDKGVLGKAAEKGKQLISDVEKTLSRVPGVSLESQGKAVSAYRDYQKALSNLTPVSASTKLAYEITAQVFNQDEVTGQSPYFTATKAESGLKSSLTGGGPEEPFWKLMHGPLDFLWTFMRLETACYLQKRWEEEVVAESQGVADLQVLQQRMLGENGFAWKFVRGTSGAFVSRNLQRGGYYAKDVRGDTIAFEPAYFTYLNRGASVAAASAAAAAAAASAAPGGGGGGGQKANYNVSIQALPTDANSDARLKPQATHLEVRCDSGTQKLDNFNYPAGATFNWSPDTCRDVILTIEVGNITLRRFWDGNMAFPKFLRDFSRGGEVTFDAKSFPESKAALERLGIRYVTVKYRFTGQGAVIALLSTQQPSQPAYVPMPNRIARCWER